MSSTDLVQLCADGEARASTEVLAAGFNVSHRSVLQLLRRYKAEIETYGLVAFEMRVRTPDPQGSGDVECAMLDERQARFFMTLMRNTVAVIDFKLQLVHEFWRLARALENHDISALRRRLQLEAHDPRSIV